MTKTNPKHIEDYFDRLWPVCRSITGNGLRESLKILSEIIPLEISEVKTGTKVFDWVIPKEWNIRDAHITTPDGKKICDFKKNNLHVVNYSIPIEAKIEFDALREHLHTLPRLPEAIPYVTSYYKEKWGFCLSQNELDTLPKRGRYKIKIDSELSDGSLSYGQYLLEGESDKEILFSTYLCHPSMANNELSGPLVLSFLYKLIKLLPKRKYSYRFVIAPETIGTLAFLHDNKEDVLNNTIAGYVLTCCGTSADPVLKKSRRENSEADKIAAHILKHSNLKHKIIDFDPIGSDERQYCSPGFDLPVASVMRSKYHEYPEYHTSLDNKNLISFDAMSETIDLYFKIVKAFELNGNYENTVRFGEPNLGKRGLYEDLSGALSMPEKLSTRMRLINFMDGTKDLLSFCEKYKLFILDLGEEIEKLKKGKVFR